MARSSSRSPVEVQVASGSQSLADEKPDIEIKTGMTEGKKYFIRVTPKAGKAVLIAVHL
jgi:hypothetical protein